MTRDGIPDSDSPAEGVAGVGGCPGPSHGMVEANVRQSVQAKKRRPRVGGRLGAP